MFLLISLNVDLPCPKLISREIIEITKERVEPNFNLSLRNNIKIMKNLTSKMFDMLNIAIN